MTTTTATTMMRGIDEESPAGAISIEGCVVVPRCCGRRGRALISAEVRTRSDLKIDTGFVFPFLGFRSRSLLCLRHRLGTGNKNPSFFRISVINHGRLSLSLLIPVIIISLALPPA